MRRDRREAAKRERKAGFGFKAIGIAYIVALVAFVVSIIMLGVLPMLYIAGIAVAIALVSFPIVSNLFRKDSEKQWKKIVASISAIIIILMSAFGTYFMANTLSFFSVISDNVQVQDFYVVVRNDSSYEKLKDIKGAAVGVMNDKDNVYEEAKAKLAKKVDVKFEEAGGFEGVAEALIKSEKDVIFINSAYYDLATEEVEGFTKDTTRILYDLKIKVKTDSNAKKVDVTEKPFNVYVSGIDTTGSIGNISRSDVNMLMTINPKTKTILLTSIPRDYYVELASKGAMDKLTHSGLYGIEETSATVANLLDTEINYTLKVNFTTVTKLVNQLGGITVNSDYNFSAGGYNFVAGENQLNGEAALAFARERYSFSGGDNQRVKNQQAVITGIINKCTSSSSVLTNYAGILGAVKENMQTTMSQKDITALVKMQLGDMSSWNIIQQSLTGSGKSTPVYSMPDSYVYVMVPDQKSVDAAKVKIDEVMGQ